MLNQSTFMLCILEEYILELNHFLFSYSFIYIVIVRRQYRPFDAVTDARANLILMVLVAAYSILLFLENTADSS